MDMKKVLVALDESNQAPRVFDAALDLAHTHQAELTLLRCIPNEIANHSIGLSEQFGMSPYLFDQAYRERNELLERRIEYALSTLRHYAAIATDAGITVSFEYKIGNPEAWICPVAETIQADVIVLGRRGRRGLTEIMLGSVSNYVLHHAPCSVFVVQPGQATEAPESAPAAEIAAPTG